MSATIRDGMKSQKAWRVVSFRQRLSHSQKARRDHDEHEVSPRPCWSKTAGRTMSMQSSRSSKNLRSLTDLQSRSLRSKLSLSDRSVDVGTIKELDDAVRGARHELRTFTRTIPPEPTTFRAFYFGNCVYTFRFLLQWFPFTMAPFSRSIVELGGLERVYLLIMIARIWAEKYLHRALQPWVLGPGSWVLGPGSWVLGTGGVRMLPFHWRGQPYLSLPGAGCATCGAGPGPGTGRPCSCSGPRLVFLTFVRFWSLQAKFDVNRDGTISQQEFDNARNQGDKCAAPDQPAPALLHLSPSAPSAPASLHPACTLCSRSVT